MEMVGYWVGPWRYRLKHPVTQRTQDIVFTTMSDGDKMERVIRRQKQRAMSELAGPKPMPGAVKTAAYRETDRSLTEIEGRESWQKKPYEIDHSVRGLMGARPDWDGKIWSLGSG